jgi:hypothetical protein
MAVWVFGLSFNASAQAPAPGINPARYRLISQGEPAPYTGVLIDVLTYRAESKKFETQDALIKGQKEEIEGLRGEVATANATITEKTRLLDYQTQLTLSCQEKATVVQQSLNTTQQAYQKAKPHWYESPIFIGAVAFIGGGYLGVRAAK